MINRKYDNVEEKIVILKYKKIQVKKTITEHSNIFLFYSEYIISVPEIFP